MDINQALHGYFLEKARKTIVEKLYISLSYTAVVTSGGNMDLSLTYLKETDHPCLYPADVDFENNPSHLMLNGILEKNPIKRTLAVPLINALNRYNALNIEYDNDNLTLFDFMEIYEKKGENRNTVQTRIAMVGYFPPVVKYVPEKNIALEVIDKAKKIGDKNAFLKN